MGIMSKRIPKTDLHFSIKNFASIGICWSVFAMNGKQFISNPNIWNLCICTNVESIWEFDLNCALLLHNQHSYRYYAYGWGQPYSTMLVQGLGQPSNWKQNHGKTIHSETILFSNLHMRNQIQTDKKHGRGSHIRSTPF